MANTQRDLDRLDTAIARPERSITFSDGRQVQLAPTSELLQKRAEVAKTVPGVRRLFRTIVQTIKGW